MRHRSDRIFYGWIIAVASAVGVARYAALAVFATGTTAVAFSALITRWFDRRRGLALGIALGGLGIGGVVWSLLTQWLIDQHGWRQAFFYLGGVIAFVVIPVMIACLRETPQSMGLNVDGEKSDVGGKLLPRPVASGLTLRQAVAGTQYWAIAVTFLLIATAAYGVMLHLVPLLRRQGLSPQAAAAAQAWLWAVLVAGRLLTGWLMDHFFAPRIAFAFLLAPIAGTVMLAMGVNGPAAIFAVMLVARSGSYASALWCLVAALGLAALLLLSFRPFPKLQPSETLSHA